LISNKKEHVQTQTLPSKPHKQCILHHTYTKRELMHVIHTRVLTDSETCVVQPQTAGGV